MPKTPTFLRKLTTSLKKAATATDEKDLESIQEYDADDPLPSGNLRGGPSSERRHELNDEPRVLFRTPQFSPEVRPPARNATSAPQVSKPKSPILKREATAPARAISSTPQAPPDIILWSRLEAPIEGFPRFGHCATREIATSGDRIYIFGGLTTGSGIGGAEVMLSVYASTGCANIASSELHTNL